MPSAFICLGFFGRDRETVIGAESRCANLARIFLLDGEAYLSRARDCESRHYDAFVPEKEPFPAGTRYAALFSSIRTGLSRSGSFSVVPGRTIGKTRVRF